LSGFLPFQCPYCGASNNALKIIEGRGVICRFCFTYVNMSTKERIRYSEKIITVDTGKVKRGILTAELERFKEEEITNLTIGRIDPNCNVVVAGTDKGSIKILRFFYDQENLRINKISSGGASMNTKILKILIKDINNDGVDEIIALDSSGNLLIGDKRKDLQEAKDFIITSFIHKKSQKFIFINNENNLVTLDLDLKFNKRRTYELPEKIDGRLVTRIVCGDFDGDSQEELFIVQAPRKVLFLDLKRRVLRWRKIDYGEIYYTSGNEYITDILSVDIDDDKSNEILILTSSSLIVYKYYHHPTAGWKVLWSKRYGNIASLKVGDIDNDSIKEIVVTTKDGRIYIIGFSGIEKFDEPIHIKLEEMESISCCEIGDADNDGFNELVVGTNKGRILLLKFKLLQSRFS